jgi:Holliday junction resolvase-like predicted endonuclease
VRRAAEAWLAIRPELGGLRLGFDVVAVRPDGLQRVEDAF